MTSLTSLPICTTAAASLPRASTGLVPSSSALEASLDLSKSATPADAAPGPLPGSASSWCILQPRTLHHLCASSAFSFTIFVSCSASTKHPQSSIQSLPLPQL
eukprot:2206831-Alexandrium_andersonii.AAC.1